MATEKRDLFKENKAEYKAGAKPLIVATGPALYLAVEGHGAPGGDAFQEAVGALYAMAFTIKMGRKKAGMGDYAVGKLEALFWSAAGLEDTPQEDWNWQLMIRTPEEVAGFKLDGSDLETARGLLKERGKDTGCAGVRLVALEEGRCVQMLHVGPYQDEEQALQMMREFMQNQGLTPAGRHHEIYISDPRRVPPERLKTILRLPVKPAC